MGRSSEMPEYVARKNPPGATREEDAFAQHMGSKQLNDLKLKTTVPSGAQTRSKDRKTLGEAGNAKAGDSNTDFSDTDDQSMNACARQANSSASRKSHHTNEGINDAGEVTATELRNERDRRGRQRYGQQPSTPAITDSKHAAMMAAARQMKAQNQTPFGIIYMDGDSYPTTTDGAPSVNEDEFNTRNDRRLPEQSAAPLAPRTGMPQRSLVRQPLGVSDQAQAQQQPLDNPRSHRAADAGLSNMPAGVVTPQALNEQDVPEGFTFAKPPAKQPQNPRGPQPHPQHQQTVSMNTAQPASTAPAATRSHNDHPSLTDRGHVAAQSFQQHQEPTPVARTGKRQQATPVAEPLTDQSEEDQEGSVQYSDEIDHATPFEREFDYDGNELFAMRYEDLRAKPFDIDPNAEGFQSPADQQADDLPKKLGAVLGLHANDQAHFFSTLSIDEWEHAGDWFLGRFGDVVSKLKAARQMKRKAAHAFEDEIEKRHCAVEQKRKVTEAALYDMKESGLQVLSGTPKKGRKAGK